MDTKESADVAEQVSSERSSIRTTACRVWKKGVDICKKESQCFVQATVSDRLTLPSWRMRQMHRLMSIKQLEQSQEAFRSLSATQSWEHHGFARLTNTTENCHGTESGKNADRIRSVNTAAAMLLAF